MSTNCYRLDMRQLIARIDDELHARLKARAALERRSLNSLVQDILDRGAPPLDERRRVRARAEAAGLLVVPPPGGAPPGRDEAIELTRGTGRAASEALEADRAER